MGARGSSLFSSSLSSPLPPVAMGQPLAEDMATDTADIIATVRALKSERDTWHTVAEQYRVAFETQTARLHQLQDICVATQAELENERTANRQLPGSTVPSSASPSKPVEQATTCADEEAALSDVDNILRGPLTADARVQGLLLKSDILRKSECVYDALAACSEAVELCDRLAELHSHLPRIQYQRGLCYYQLHMGRQARDALAQIHQDDSLLYARATEMRQSCEERLEASRRSAFEARRTVTDGFLAQVDIGRLDVRLQPNLSLPTAKPPSRSTAVQVRSLGSMPPKRGTCPCLIVGSQPGPGPAEGFRSGSCICALVPNFCPLLASCSPLCATRSPDKHYRHVPFLC